MNTYAFPSGHDPKTGTAQFGMNLRDYFAAKAMSSIIDDLYKDKNSISQNEECISEIAISAYQMADQMMKAREL